MLNFRTKNGCKFLEKRFARNVSESDFFEGFLSTVNIWVTIFKQLLLDENYSCLFFFLKKGSLAISLVGNRVMILCSKGFYSCISRKSCSFTSVISKSIVEETSSLAYALRVTCQKPQNWHIYLRRPSKVESTKKFLTVRVISHGP